ncbi:MAG TPA: caspase family protein [Burkholderiales bacterium]|nr:caspase family protein [Burkholderiales bacterium]
MAVALGAAAQTRDRTLSIQPSGQPGEPRHALVIGNTTYTNGPLKNAVNDARAMAKALGSAGFSVRVVEDATHIGMQRAVRLWGNDIAKGGVGLFYYAGHGLQVKGKNYLVPVNAEIDQEDEIEFTTLDVNVVLAKMDSAKNALNIVILDACRNNPFARSFRSVSRGLAQMDAPTGTFIAFATAPGSVASDGTGVNGIYTEHLLREMARPGVPIEQMFKQVRIGVINDTKGQQIPWESSSLRGDFAFRGGLTVAAAPSQAVVAEAVAEALKREREAQTAAMEKMIQAALERQRVMLEAQGLKVQPPVRPAPAVPDPREKELKAAAEKAAAERSAAEKALAEAREAARKAEAETKKAAAERMAADKAAANLAAAEKSASDRTAAAKLAAERAAAERLAAEKAAAELKAARDRAAAEQAQAARLATQRAAAEKAKAAQVQLASVAPVAVALSSPSARLPQAGDSWSYRLSEPKGTVRSYGVKIAAASGMAILEEYALEGRAAHQWAHSPGGYLVGLESAVFSPYLAAFQDLPARGSLGRIAIADPACTSTYICQADGEVMGHETVTVPAGTFQATKVRIRHSWRTNFVSGYSSLSLNGGRDLFVWYVPELKRAVKFSSRPTYGESPLLEAHFDLELVSHQLK